MKAGWIIKNLGEVCDFQNGFAFKSNLFTETGHPILRISNIQCEKVETRNVVYFQLKDYNENLEKYRIVNGDLLIAMSGGTTGKVGFNTSDEEYYLNQRVGKFEPSDCLLKKYLFYFLLARVEDNLRISAGSAQPNLSTQQVKEFKIPVPPVSEQQRIVAILDEAFEAIAAARANAEKNRQNARALFESYLQSVFSQRGEGWVEKKVGEICVLKSGTSVSVSLEKQIGDLPYVKVSDMNHEGNETEIHSSSRFLDMTDIGKNAVFPVGTTIFPKRGGAILTNKKRLTAVPICADLNIMGVIPPDTLSARLLYYYFLNVDMKLLGSGSSIPQINNYDIAPLILFFPEDQKMQNEVVQYLDALSVETQRLESLYQRKIAALDELKQSLLQQAFSGQL